MKRINLLIGFIVLALFSCDERSFDPVFELKNAPSITSPDAGTNFILDETMAESNITQFAWTAADFGFNGAVTYTLEYDIVGNNFASPLSLGTTNQLAFEDISNGKFNNILLASGRPFGVASNLEIRVCGSVSNTTENLCSEGVPINVTPYRAEVVYPTLQVPGSYQDWDPADEATSIYSRQSNDIYQGYLYFTTDNTNYKYAQGGSWDINWGDDEPDGVLNEGGFGNDIVAEFAGLHKLDVDLNTLEHGQLKTDWGLLGSATNETEIMMTWDEDLQALVANTNLAVGTFKFRANGSWDLNYGDNLGNGALQEDGTEITITEAGSYNVVLNLVASDYSYTLTTN
ncbi:MAG: SusE domain-containing protein [Bacteroidota bacterium]